jgi:hypothetical protein
LNNEIIHLFTRYLNNQCSKTELERVFKLIEEGSNKSEWDFVLAEEASRLVGSDHRAEMSLDEITRLYGKIQDSISEEGHKIVVLRDRNLYWRKFAAAAIILITLSVGAFYYSSRLDTKSDKLVHDVAPGGNKAVLTLANGKKIILTDAKTERCLHNPVLQLLN